MFRKGVKLFTLSNALVVFIAIFHTISIYATPVNKAGIGVMKSMESYQVDMGLNMHPSLFDIYRSFGVVISLFLIFIVMLNLSFARVKEYRILREVALINCLFFGGLAVIYFYYRLPIPLIGFIIVSILFLIAVFQISKMDSTKSMT